jgi:hypothetical protein
MKMTTDRSAEAFAASKRGATFENMRRSRVQGQRIFEGAGQIVFIDPLQTETNPPSWLGWTEDGTTSLPRNGAELCWGVTHVSPERPVGGEPLSFYASRVQLESSGITSGN